MIASTHLTAGAAVGMLSYRYLFRSDSIGGLGGALAAGILSHLVLDMIPHSEEELYRPDGSNQFMSLILVWELGMTFLAIYLCAPLAGSGSYQNFYLLSGLVGGALPDVPHVLMEIFDLDWKWLKAVDQVNVFFHTSFHAPSFWQGFVPQILIIVLSLSVLCLFKIQLVKIAP